MSSRAYGEEGEIFSWYLAGSLPGQSSDGMSYTIAVIIEKDEIALAQAIGQRLVLQAIDQ